MNKKTDAKKIGDKGILDVIVEIWECVFIVTLVLLIYYDFISNIKDQILKLCLTAIFTSLLIILIFVLFLLGFREYGFGDNNK